MACLMELLLEVTGRAVKNYHLNPNYPLKFFETKIWSFDVWAANRKQKISFFQNFATTAKLHLSQAFWQHQACPIPILYES
jgi:hypothetical protein